MGQLQAWPHLVPGGALLVSVRSTEPVLHQTLFREAAYRSATASLLLGQSTRRADFMVACDPVFVANFGQQFCPFARSRGPKFLALLGRGEKEKADLRGCFAFFLTFLDDLSFLAPT